MNEELRNLYEEEREDSRGYWGGEPFLAAQARRVLLERRLQTVPNYLTEAEDFFHAAFLMQHGEEPAHWLKAHELARQAAELGEEKARYLVAASLDRFLMRQGRPQKYGTNGVWDAQLDGWRIWNYEHATTDAERAEWSVPTLAELLARIEYSNQDFKKVPPRVKKAFAAKTVAGYELLLTNLEDTGLFSGGGLPSYLPLEPAKTQLPQTLPPGLSFWQFDDV